MTNVEYTSTLVWLRNKLIRRRNRYPKSGLINLNFENYVRELFHRQYSIFSS